MIRILGPEERGLVLASLIHWQNQTKALAEQFGHSPRVASEFELQARTCGKLIASLRSGSNLGIEESDA